MSLGCTPQTGKVLKYNSSVNNQLAHQNCSTDTRQLRQQNCPEKEERTVKKRKGVIRETGDGELAPGLTPTTHDSSHPTPIAVTVRDTG